MMGTRQRGNKKITKKLLNKKRVKKALDSNAICLTDGASSRI